MDGQRIADGVILLERGLVKHQVVVLMGNPEVSTQDARRGLRAVAGNLAEENI